MNEGRDRRWAEAYHQWLVPQTREAERQPRTYTDLLQVMQYKEFVWIIPNDDNRIVDGLDLRMEFIQETDAPNDLSPNSFGPCSVLEVLIGLSRRLAFATNESPESWAWILITNLELDKFPDPLSRRNRDRVNEVLECLIWRQYNPDGSGGFFPLQKPEEDQTHIELWYQLSAYVNEIHPEY